MKNQIIEVPNIAVVKTVDNTKKLLSLRDQQVKKGGLMDFCAGSGIKYNGNLYILDSGKIEILRMTILKTNPSFATTKNSDITVDWGDGTIERNVFSHVYDDKKEGHEVKFYGKNTALRYLGCMESNITLLDVSRNVMLKGINCSYNSLTQLDVSHNKVLNDLIIDNNFLSELDLSNNKGLDHIDVVNNPFTLSLDTLTEFLNLLPDRTGDTSQSIRINYNADTLDFLKTRLIEKNWTPNFVLQD